MLLRIRLYGFRAQTAFLYGGLVVLLAATLSVVFGVVMVRQIHEEAGLALHVVAQNVTRTLATGLEERRMQVDALAASKDLWSHGLGSKEVHDALERAQASGTHNAWIGVADLDGKVLAATSGHLIGQSVKERPWFAGGLRGTYFGDVHGAKLLAKVLPSAANGEPLRFVDFSAPIFIDGKKVGVVGKHGSWEWADAVVEAMVPSDAVAIKVQVFIFNRDGQAIYAPAGIDLASAKIPRTAVAPPATVRRAGPAVVTEWDDARDYLTAVSTLTPMRAANDLGWTIVVRQPLAIAFAPARSSLWFALIVGTFGACLAMGIAWFVSGRLSHPLTSIARAARNVERGVAGAQIPIFMNNRELAGLSSALSEMTRRLLASNEKLEARVRERTAELEAANIELEKLARHDPLTGLLNRRAFEERLDIATATSKRTGAAMSMLIVDADHFKSINDRYGHEAGDEVLKALTVLLKERLRETDSVARIGGEEFAVLLPNTDEAGALLVAQQIVERASSATIPQVGRVTVSVGAATSHYTPTARTDLMRHADQALYAAKNGGRNRAHQFRQTLALAA